MRLRANRGALLALPLALLLGLAAVLVVSHGGYSATTWYPAALFVLALLAVLLGAGVAGPRSWTGLAGAALAVYAAYVAWSYASIAWADVPALAWDGANRSLLYGLVLAVVGLRRWSVRELRVVLGVVAGGIALIAVGVLIAGMGGNPAHLFLEGRLADPMGYANATPNLWLIGCFGALWLAIDRAVPWPVRGAMVGVAGFLAQMSLLSQSRGAIAAFGLVAVAFVVCSPRRLAALAAVAAAVGVTLATSAPVLDVHDAMVSQELGPLFADARLAILVASAGMLLLGLVVANVDDHFASGGRFGANTRRANLVLAVGAGAALVALVVAMGNPVTWVEDRWHDFKTSGYSSVDQPGQTRLTGSLGSQRYDVYRVALNDFADQPLTGVGVDSFGPSYLLHGRTDQNPRYAHSFAMSLLAETGIVGTLLFAAFLALMVAALVRASRAGPGARGPVLGAAAGAAMFLGGAMFDWLWQFPALAVFAFVLLGMAANVTAAPATAAGPQAVPSPAGSAWTLRAVFARLLGGLLVLAAALSLIAPGVAARFVDSAYDSAGTDPHVAVKRLDRAADLNPLSAAPLLAKNVVLRRLGDAAGARHALDAAAEREPDNWFIPFERALLDSAARRWDSAAENLARAKALNPRQVVIDNVLAAVRRHEVFSAERAEAQLAAETARKLKPTS